MVSLNSSTWQKWAGRPGPEGPLSKLMALARREELLLVVLMAVVMAQLNQAEAMVISLVTQQTRMARIRTRERTRPTKMAQTNLLTTLRLRRRMKILEKMNLESRKWAQISLPSR